MSYALSHAIGAKLRDGDRRIVIAGAGGWLGLATLELLADALGDALCARVRCFGSSGRVLTLLSGDRIEQRPLAELGKLDEVPTLLLHLAFLTKDRAENMAEADYRYANRALTGLVLDNLDRIGAESAFVASSGAARFADDPSRSPAMRLYGELKRDDERAFAAWANTTGKRTVTARIFNIAGPHINKLHSYALSAFILNALAGRPIEVKATHRVVRGYVAIRELMSLVFALLLERKAGVIQFDTGGCPMELEEVAKLVAAETGASVVRAPISHDRTDEYVGDAAVYDDLLRENGIVPVAFAQQIAETRAFMASAAIPISGEKG
ncbi:MAG: NAD-dependent epimerase/dehydratase family protein [Sphingomicrobium sp.]|nr:NAD(P)-dependent oxidoreductase [Sphingomonadales bacterium]